jgi:Family of unknown function (DUF6502)
MSTRQDFTLRAVLRVLRPLVRMLVREGVTYPALAAALKPLFVDAAHAELQRQGMRQTASATSLLSGVHRKDLREMAAPATAKRARGADVGARLHLVGQVVARWMSARGWQAKGRPRVLPRSGGTRSFDALVASVSQDVRARAVLDEMLRLGVVQDTADGLALTSAGLVPRAGFDAMSEALAVNLHDHAAAAVANVGEGRNFLDQALYVDEITDASVVVLERDAVQAWRAAFATLMASAQERFDTDARDAPPDARTRRLRFGVYCWNAPMDDVQKEPTP